MKRILSIVTVLALCLTLFPATTSAVGGVTCGDFTVSGGTLGADFSYRENTLRILSDAVLTISGTTASDKIYVEDGVSANITLNNCEINMSAAPDAAAFQIADGSKGNITIALEGENKLTSGANCAGLQKNGGIDTGTLTIDGPGKLLAQSGAGGAGIGGASGNESSNIIISGGTVEANSNGYGAGIGGGNGGDKDNPKPAHGNNITISGGIVTASGGNNAAGIGGGTLGDGNNITISGGTVTANGGYLGAGIGGGMLGAGNHITISGGRVHADGGGYGAGIGGGAKGRGSNITVSGGIVNAEGGNKSAGIGGGGDEYNPGGGGAYGLKIDGGIIIASSIGSGSNGGYAQINGNSVVFQGKSGSVYGNCETNLDWEIPSGYYLTIPAGTSLTVGDDATLTNNGTIKDEGSFLNYGTVVNDSNITVNGVVDDYGTTINHGKIEKMSVSPSLAVAGSTSTSITLAHTGGKEYSMDGVTWQPGNVFTGLTPTTGYTFYARYTDKSSIYYDISDNSTVSLTAYTAFTAPAAGEGYTINYVAETAAAESGYELTTSEGADAVWETGTISVTPGHALYVRMASNGDIPAGDIRENSVASRPAAPNNNVVAFSGDTDDRILTFDGDLYEVSASSDFAAAIPSGSAVRYGTMIYVRTKATDSVFAGEAVLVVVPASDKSDAVFEIGSKEDFEIFVQLVNGGATGLNAVLTADIALWRWREQTCLEYSGVFDGQGHTISDLNFENNIPAVAGLFGTLSGTVKNLTLRYCEIYFSSSSSASSSAVGLMAGRLTKTGVIQDCLLQRPSIMIGPLQGASVGSVAGSNSGTIENVLVTDCYARPNNGSIGLIAGSNTANGNINNCYASSYDDFPICGEDSGTITNSSIVDRTQLRSGEIAYHLNNGRIPAVWGMNSSNPVLGGNMVYKVTAADGTVSYAAAGSTVAEGNTVQVGDGHPTVTIETGTIATLNNDGSVTLAADGTAIIKDTEITLPGGGMVGPDGGVTVPNGGEIIVKGDAGDTTTITPPAGAGITINDGGTVTVPGGSTVQTENGEAVTVPGNGGVLDLDTGEIAYLYIVTFDSQGGSDVASLTVTDGSLVTRPTNPSMSGYTFGGWYKDAGCTTAWNFGTDTVTADVTLYAKWTKSVTGGIIMTTYPPVIETADGGSVTVRPAKPKPGDTVTITITPDEHYKADILTVTDQNGKLVAVTNNGDGTYRFTQPGGTVTIRVTYKSAEMFADVDESAWYYEAVRFVRGQGLMNGYTDGRFGPNDTLSRAQFAQILFNKEGRPVVNYLMRFEDVHDGTWYTEAVRWSASQGIVSGYGSRFGPNDSITREQLAVMLWRYSGSPAATNKALRFSDAGKISDYAVEAMRWAVENGVINGYGNGQLDPHGTSTRAQVAQVLKNYLETAI